MKEQKQKIIEQLDTALVTPDEWKEMLQFRLTQIVDSDPFADREEVDEEEEEEEEEDKSDSEEEKDDGVWIELTKDGGVKKKITTEGKGDAPTLGQKVHVHYKGWLDSNGKVFDSNYDKDPIRINIGKGQVI